MSVPHFRWSLFVRTSTARASSRALSLAAALLTVGCTARTSPAPLPAATDSGAFVLEQATHQRWLNGAQRPEHTPFDRVSTAPTIVLGAPDTRTGARTIRVRAPRGPADSAAIIVQPGGRVVRQDAWLATSPAPPFPLPEDSARFARFRLRGGRHLALPLTRVWDLVPPVHPRRFAAGERWTDTIALATELDGARQTLNGTRTSVLVRDTTIATRRLWLIRDSARVRYTEHDLETERTLDTLVSIDRTASGTIIGHYLYDPALAFPRERDDTTSLTGEAVLRYPDGRSFQTPTRYDRTRHWALLTPDAYATRQAALRAESNRTYSGPVMAPSNPIEERLAAGDTTVRDSLIAAWVGERDPDRRAQLYRVLRTWGSRGRDLGPALDSIRIAAGDSAFYLEQLANRAYPARPPIDVPSAQQMIRVMGDPAIAFALGASRDVLYENLVQTLTLWPPALAPDSASRRCLPDACRLLEGQWRSAQEPRLRDVGLAALVTSDPVRWADTVIARVTAGSVVLRPVADLMNGVGATWPAAARLPLPAPGADWRAWRAWSNAPHPRYRPPPTVRVRTDAMRFEESHATAIRFYQLRTGRDVVGEVRRAYAAATDDSARLVFGTMLTGLGDAASVEQVAAQFRSGSPAQIALAQQRLRGLFGPRAPRADSATRTAVLERLIASSVDRTAPWPALGATSTAPPSPSGNPVGPTAELTYILADSVPRALRDRWRTRVAFISADEWQAMSLRQAATLRSFSVVERVGPFVRVSEQVAGRIARQPNETPRLFYGSTTYYLLAQGDGWVVVGREMSVT